MEIKPLKSWPFYLKLACVLFSLIALCEIIVVARELLSPLVLSCLFAILLLPLGAFFEKRLKLPRSVAAMFAVLILLGAIALVLYVIGSQLAGLAADWPQFQEQLQASLDTLQTWVAQTFHVNAGRQLTYVHAAADKLLSSGTAVVGATLLSLSSLLLFFVFTFIYTFFLLLYRKLILQFLESVFLEENKRLVHEIIEQVQSILRKYIAGLLLEMGIVATVVCAAFWTLGIKYALLLGLLTALFNIIPYIGIFTALLLSTLITFANAATGGKVLLVIITLVLTHLADSNILLPVIVGSKVRINALITVLGVIIGEMIWGIPGMFLSIPVIAVLKIIFDRVESLRSWGILLGDEQVKTNRLAVRLAVKRRKNNQSSSSTKKVVP